MKNTIENNRIEVRDRKGQIIFTESFATAEHAHDEWVAKIKELSENVKAGELFNVIRYRWGRIMTIKCVKAV